MPEVALKEGWARVAFGDVVKLSGERSSNLEEDGFERFVGLEHIDPGDLKIRRWGDIADGTTFTSVFRPGQVLFGKRRAYQRKVAVADFSGVCSGDIYVLEPKNAHLLPELLPFICQTDGFFEHAVGTSAGSLSPRTNWESLASYEFALPPLEEQQRVAFAMWATEMQRRAYRRLADSSTLARRSLAASLFATTNYGQRLQRLGDAVVHSAYGPRFAASRYVDSGNAWTIRTTDFAPSGGIDYSSVPAARLGEEVVADHRLLDGDFLLSRSGEYAGMVRVFDGSAAPDKPYIPAAFLIRFRLDRQHLLPQFLLEYCESVHGEVLLKRIAQGSAQPNISGSAFMNLQVPVPSLDEQEVVCKHLEQARMAEISARERLLGAERLSKKISALLLNGDGS